MKYSVITFALPFINLFCMQDNNDPSYRAHDNVPASQSLRNTNNHYYKIDFFGGNCTNQKCNHSTTWGYSLDLRESYYITYDPQKDSYLFTNNNAKTVLICKENSPVSHINIEVKTILTSNDHKEISLYEDVKSVVKKIIESSTIKNLDHNTHLFDINLFDDRLFLRLKSIIEGK